MLAQDLAGSFKERKACFMYVVIATKLKISSYICLPPCLNEGGTIHTIAISDPVD